jgi:tetratricopeptide (TPR) repeat protein
VQKYPFERQYYNVGLAYFAAGDYANVVKSQKEALEKFNNSSYVGGYYRQLGRAYQKLGRDQTAEKTFVTGVQAVDARLAELAKSGPVSTIEEEKKRLLDDKVGMLLALRKLHQTYKAQEKLKQVERQLKEAGYGR